MAYCVNGCWSVLSNVGIGTDDLATYHPAFMSPSLNIVGSRPGVNLENTGGSLGTIRLKGTAPAGEMHINFDGTSCTNGRLYFYAYGCTNRSVLTLGLNGNVGVGTDTPGALLQVRGPNAAGTFFDAQNDGAAGATFSRIADTFPFNRYTFANGNVGIGTAAPLSNVRLQICDANTAGTDDMVRLSQCLPGNHAWYRSERCGGATMLMGPTRNSADGCVPADSAIIWTTGNNPIVIGTCGRQRMRFSTSGNAVLGGTNSNIVGFTGTVLTVNGGGNYQGYEVSTSDVTRMTMVSDGNNGYLSTRVAGMCLIFEAGAASEKMRITSNGLVGVGTSSPSSKLDVSGTDGRIQSRVDSSDGSTINVRPNAGKCGWISYTEDAVADRWGIGVKNGDSKLYFASGNVGDGGGTTRMVIDGGGSVGLGTTTPCTRLSIKCSTGSIKIDLLSLTTTDGAGSQPTMRFDTIEANCNVLGRISVCDIAPYAGAMIFETSGCKGIGSTTTTELMRLVGTTGNVGINTTSPSYRLHVNGTFYAAGSSIEYKQGISQYDTDSCLFMCLKPKTYQYKDEWKHLGKDLKSGTQIGLIAEEVAEVMPELAVLVNEEENKVVRNVDYEKLSIILLSEVQKLRKEVDNIKNNK
jgi:hypothetical protein